MKIIAVLGVVVLLIASAARAAYNDVGVSARASGMGGAVTAVSDDAFSISYNPSGLATLVRPELANSYTKFLTGLSDGSNLQNSYFAYAQPLNKGEWGGIGAAWNYFALDALYRESSVYGAYGRQVLQDDNWGRLLGGFSLKYLSRSIGGLSVTNQPLGPNGGVVPGASDPVLQAGSKSNIDADFGFLYKPRPRVNLGLDVQHVMEPNIAFSPSDTDRLGRNYKLGAAYRTPFTTLAADLDFTAAPDGSADKTVILGGEKWLPTLIAGVFGLRGAVAAGTRNYRQVSLGISYKLYRMQFDYGFAMPLGGVSGTIGTHRLGLTFRFGDVSAPELGGEAILESMDESKLALLISNIQAETLRRPVPAPPAPPVVPAPPVPAPPAVPISTAPAPAVPEAPAVPQKLSEVDNLLTLMQEAFQHHDYNNALKLSQDILRIEPSNILAHRSMGTAYHALRRYPEALKAFEAAYALETGPQKKRLETVIETLKSLIKRRTVQPAKAAAPPAQTVKPEDIERLYDQGVAYYSKGKLRESAEVFREILAIQPDNASARRALKRVENEMMQNNEKP